MSERENQNFDHPNSLDTDLLIEHVRQLRKGETADIPNYDFSTHSRTSSVTKAEPRQVILVEGILIFADVELTDLLDVKIFVDTESDVRLIRRITRDCQERGRR
jgi:uridine kinase